VATFPPSGTGITASDFLEHWGTFLFHAEYAGVKYDKVFSRDTVESFTRMQFPETGPHVTTKEAPQRPPGPPSVPSASNLSPADKATNLDIWNSVNTDCLNKLSTGVIDSLYKLLDDWPLKIKTDRAGFKARLSNVKEELNADSTCVEKSRNTYPNYKDISQILEQPYISPTRDAIDEFARAIDELPQELPADFDVELRRYAG
jgi:hypothetical protein